MSEIIIDGVNVAECEFFQSEYLEDNSIFCKFCTLFYNACLSNSDCYYKQLQRAKAELKQYKKSKQASYENMQAEWNKAVNELRDVKAENEKLKEALEEIKDRLIVVTEEEPQSTINLVLDLKPIIEKILKEDK